METKCWLHPAWNFSQVFHFHFSLRLSLTLESNGVFALLPPQSQGGCNGLLPANAQVSTPQKYPNCHLVMGSRCTEAAGQVGKAVGRKWAVRRDNHCGYKRLNTAHVQNNWNQLVYSELELNLLQISEIDPNHIITSKQSCNRET